jgi:hypothetical protein
MCCLVLTYVFTLLLLLIEVRSKKLLALISARLLDYSPC